MSYTDFHYTPTGTGVISGKQVLEQTEDAINDLGGQISGDVQTAIDTANNALNTANTASADAQNAVNTANTAHTAATNAQNTANAAQTTATNAQTAAQNAQNDVNALGNRVTTAENNITQNTTDISGLTTRMGTAEGNITTLQNNVVTAQGTATSAQNTATMARQQSYVLRYSSTAITDNSTIAYSTLDNTDNIKADDKIIDVDGKIFSVVSVDTANQTVTVGSALIDLALDANVVHTSGNETINGVKSFINYFLGKDLSGQTVDLNDCVDAYGGAIHYYYAVSNYTNISNKPENKPFILESKTVRYVSSIDYIYYQKIYTADYNTPPSIYTRYYRSGSASWSNWVKDTNKFVTTDTAQTISGAKTFSSTPVIYNSDTSGSTANLYFRNLLVTKGDTSTNGSQLIRFSDSADKILSRIQTAKASNGNTILNLRADALDTNNNDVSTEIQIISGRDGSKSLGPQNDNAIDLGRILAKWKNLYVNQINGLTPSSLGMPSDNLANIIDISGYLTVLDGSQTNTYQAPDNGYIGITMNSCSGVQAYITGFWGHQIVRPSIGGVRFFMPICKNMTANILIFGGTIDNARFIPCQGNI